MWERTRVSSPFDGPSSSEDDALNYRTSLTNPNRNISFGRRHEDEALEIRKLFMTKSSKEDMDLVYRAYIVGRDALNKILRMNAYRRDQDLRISMSSILVEMKQISHESISQCKNLLSRLLNNLPQQVLDKPNSKLLSPFNFDDTRTFMDYRWLSLSSTILPIRDVIEKESEFFVKKREEEFPPLISSPPSLVYLGCCN
jgi:hypothetical protein